MTEQFAPGTPVDVTIRGAEIVATWPDGQIEVAYGTGQHKGEACVYPDHPTVTVTRLAPTPQAGQVWVWPDGDVRHIVCGFKSTVLWGNRPDGTELTRVSNLDFSHARCVYPLTDEPTLAAYRRVLVDGGGGVWAETAPNSEEYLSGVGNRQLPRTRAWIRETYRVARDYTPAEAARYTGPTTPTAGVTVNVCAVDETCGAADEEPGHPSDVSADWPPQPADVWDWDGAPWVAYLGTGGDVWLRHATEPYLPARRDRSIGATSGLRLLTRVATAGVQAEDAAAGNEQALRQFTTRLPLWTETGYQTGRYHCHLNPPASHTCATSTCGMTREEMEKLGGELIDLGSVPVVAPETDQS